MEIEEAKQLSIPRLQRSERPTARMQYTKQPARNKSATQRSTSVYRRKVNIESKSGIKERMILQATLCAGILATLLFINLFDTNISNTVIGLVSTNISNDMLQENSVVADWIDNVVDIVNQQNISEEPAYIDAALQDNQEQPQGIRIDENILNYINNIPNIYYENNR